MPKVITASATPAGPRNLFATAENAFVTAADVQTVILEAPSA